MSEDAQKQSASEEEDRAAISAVLAGHTEAFAFIDRKYRRKLSAMIRRIIGNNDDVEDLVQDTFLKALRALSTFRHEYSFEKWLFKIASNTCIDYLRRKRFAPEALEHSDDTEDEPPRQYADPNSSVPDEQLIRQERYAIVRAAIEALPEKYRVVIHLRHDLELDYEEIAQRLDLPLGTVKAHLFRARQLLLKALSKYRHLFES